MYDPIMSDKVIIWSKYWALSFHFDHFDDFNYFNYFDIITTKPRFSINLY